MLNNEKNSVIYFFFFYNFIFIIIFNFLIIISKNVGENKFLVKKYFFRLLNIPIKRENFKSNLLHKH